MESQITELLSCILAPCRIYWCSYLYREDSCLVPSAKAKFRPNMERNYVPAPSPTPRTGSPLYEPPLILLAPEVVLAVEHFANVT